MFPSYPAYTYKSSPLGSGENMPRVIKVEALADAYKLGVGAKSSKWYNGILAATGITAAGASDAAETRYAAKVQEAIASKSRQNRLKLISDEDVKAPIRAAGSGGIWSTPAQNKAPKFQKNFAPYAAVINATVATLPPKGTDPLSNLTSRAGPIVTALHNKKVSGT